jgi:hypothetical protein
MRNGLRKRKDCWHLKLQAIIKCGLQEHCFPGSPTNWCLWSKCVSQLAIGVCIFLARKPDIVCTKWLGLTKWRFLHPNFHWFKASLSLSFNGLTSGKSPTVWINPNPPGDQEAGLPALLRELGRDVGAEGALGIGDPRRSSPGKSCCSDPKWKSMF